MDYARPPVEHLHWAGNSPAGERGVMIVGRGNS